MEQLSQLKPKNSRTFQAIEVGLTLKRKAAKYMNDLIKYARKTLSRAEQSSLNHRTKEPLACDELLPKLAGLARCSQCHRRARCAQVLLATHRGEQSSPVCRRCLWRIWGVEPRPLPPSVLMFVLGVCRLLARILC